MSKTLYLDMAQWRNLTDGKSDSRLFENLLELGQYTPVLSFTHLLELTNPVMEEDTRHRTLEYMDRIISVYQCKWIRPLSLLARMEAQYALEKSLNLNPRMYEVYGDHFIDVSRNSSNMTWYDKAEGRTRSLTYTVNLLMSESTALADYHKTRQEYSMARRKIQLHRKGKKFTNKEKRRWFVSLLPDIAATPEGVTYPISLETKNMCAKTVELTYERFPAVMIDMAFNDGWNITSCGKSNSDFEDWLHLAGPAYCDISFVDRRTRDVLRKAKFPVLPYKNGEFDAWLSGSHNMFSL